MQTLEISNKCKNFISIIATLCLAFIALLQYFLGVNNCILQYSIAFLASIAIAIVLRAIANSLVGLLPSY